MQPLLFTLLLLTCLLNLTPADAIPTRARRQGNSGTVTVPLRRLEASRGTGLHPRVLLQQRINRASKRLARMTGRKEPSEHTLRSELNKRLYLLEGGPGSRFGTAPANKRHHRIGMAAGAAGCTTVTGKGTNTGEGTTAGGITPGSSTNTGVSPLNTQAAGDGATAANPPTANNSLPLSIDGNDIAFLATIQIGTPPRDFQILVDSGSADFWVSGDNCQSQQGGCGNQTTLGTQSSSSFVQSTTEFEVSYGSGAVQGLLCQDNVNIAGLELKNHTFGVTTAESSQFTMDPNIGGMMGFAKSAISRENVPTPVEALAANGLIQSPITSFKIPRFADHLDDGEITFGGLDPTKFVANSLVTFDNTNAEGFWGATMDAIMANNVDVNLTGRTAILDTGTTLIIAPPSDAQTVMQSLGGTCDTQQCTIPCTTQASLALSFGNQPFAIDHRDLIYEPVDPNDPTGTCIAGIHPQQIVGATEWLVGDVFLKNVYFSINVKTNKISLAKLTT